MLFSLLPLALCVCFVAVRDAETRRAWQEQQENANAAAEAAALQAMQEKSTRLAGNYSAVARCTKLLNRGIRRMSVRVLGTKSTV